MTDSNLNGTHGTHPCVLNPLGPRATHAKESVGRREDVCTDSQRRRGHKQIPIAPRDWHLTGCQVRSGGIRLHQYGGHAGRNEEEGEGRVRLVPSVADGSSQTAHSVRRGAHFTNLAYARRGRLPPGRKSEYRPAWLVLLIICALSSAPLPCNKSAGGDLVVWEFFELLHHTTSWECQHRKSGMVRAVDATGIDLENGEHDWLHSTN